MGRYVVSAVPVLLMGLAVFAFGCGQSEPVATATIPAATGATATVPAPTSKPTAIPTSEPTTVPTLEAATASDGTAGEHGAAATEPESGTTPKEESMDEYTMTPSGLQYKDLTVGDGAAASQGDTAVVHYTGWLLDGTKFDSSVDRGTPFEFPLGAGRVIRGWDEGVGSMNVGGKRELIIPSDLAYGDRGAGGVIPGGATLKFEVELLGLK